MKKIISFCIGLALPLLSWAAAYKAMEFSCADGTVHAIDLNGLTIDFDGTKFSIANSKSDALELPAVNVKSMRFVTQTTAIENIEAELEGQTTAYALDGTVAGTAPTAAKLIDTLKAGIYILKAHNGTTTKIIIGK